MNSIFHCNVERLIRSCCAEEITSSAPTACPYPTIYIPKKQLAFHLIPIPTYSVEHNQQYQLQQLSLDAKSKGVHLIHLFEDIWTTKNSIACYRIRSLLGSFQRIHARKATVARIAKPTLDAFLAQNHLYGSPTARYKYGLFSGSQLVAAASFSAGRPIARGGKVFRSFELVRFANLGGYVVTGGIGKLLQHFINEVQPDDVMSYADLDWASGKSYEKLGFTLDGIAAPQEFWMHPKELVRYYSHKPPQQLVAECHPAEYTLSSNGYVRFFNSGNIKYLLLLK